MAWQDTLNQLKEKFLSLSTSQKALVIGVPLAVLALLSLLLFYAGRPNYVILYGGLSSEDLNAVLSELDKEGIKYKLSPDGSTIFVPEDKARDLRLKLAAKGIPSKGIVGYEVFDKERFGVSDFQNQVNFKRAVEGELAKTIMRIEGVDYAKVNIGMPEKSIFLREEDEPTASVLIRLKPGHELLPEQVKAIRNLVALSVPRLNPKNVVVVDDKGRDLTALIEEDEILKDKELKLKAEFEKNLERKIQKTLEEALGVGTVKVKVSADIDFTRREQKEEIYDPDMTAIVSQQKKKERTFGAVVGGVPGASANVPPGTGAVQGTGPLTSEKSETITNYEVSKKEVYTQDPLIKVRRLNVGVMIDSNLKGVDLEKVKQMVQASAGIDPNRGDVLNVVSVPFKKPEVEKLPISYAEYIKWVALLVFSLVSLLAFFIALKRLKKKPAPTAYMPPVPTSVPSELEELAGVEEIRIKAKEVASIEAISKLAKEEPQKVAKIIKAWLKSKG
ncbi:flagellar basal-body MS-ring/collar protein FliF [Thermocrinis sp.]|jgi:flagellar M-ring protein FliF|uniref:flagellar basal-body MS-ring/collar protein FliF n=1 Tax=Thermocrinis sp. TaxID=2024383 RepID=UPI0026353FEB|nr:flagellar basal-body MS-ring/collar protein FliF [Thermocrinis sp.]